MDNLSIEQKNFEKAVGNLNMQPKVIMAKFKEQIGSLKAKRGIQEI